MEWLNTKQPGWLTEPQSAEEKLVAEALLQEQIRALFPQQPRQEAYREQSIDAVEGEKWIFDTIDRLVLTRSGKKVVAAGIVDFKTDIRRGDTEAEQDAHLCDTHRAQMRAYHALICRAYDLPSEAVSVTLISCPRDGSSACAVRCEV